MSASKFAFDTGCRHNRLVREYYISFPNIPDKLLGGHPPSVEIIRDSVHVVVPPVGVYLGYANPVVPGTRLDCNWRVHANAHPSKYGAFDYPAPAT